MDARVTDDRLMMIENNGVASARVALGAPPLLLVERS